MSESEYVDRTPLDDPAWVIALVEERDALRARVRELEGALEKYGEHEVSCEFYDGNACDCGLESALPAPAPGRDTDGGPDALNLSRDLAGGGTDGG